MHVTLNELKDWDAAWAAAWAAAGAAWAARAAWAAEKSTQEQMLMELLLKYEDSND